MLGGGSTLGLAEEDCDVGSNQSCQSILEIVARFRSVCGCVCRRESRTIQAWLTIRSFQNVDLVQNMHGAVLGVRHSHSIPPPFPHCVLFDDETDAIKQLFQLTHFDKYLATSRGCHEL